eukprot:3556804-Amphidinium_carterae.1
MAFPQLQRQAHPSKPSKPSAQRTPQSIKNKFNGHFVKWLEGYLHWQCVRCDRHAKNICKWAQKNAFLPVCSSTLRFGHG